MTTDGQITMATFTCTSGYHQDGATTLTCHTTGQWDNNPPLCSKVYFYIVFKKRLEIDDDPR